MKVLFKILISAIGLISGLITIITLFIKPEVIGTFLYQHIRISMLIVLIPKYSKFLILFPLLTGIISSHKYGGFSFPRMLSDPLHLISSFVIFEFWSGFASGIKYIGYLAFPLFILLLLGGIHL